MFTNTLMQSSLGYDGREFKTMSFPNIVFTIAPFLYLFNLLLFPSKYGK